MTWLFGTGLHSNISLVLGVGQMGHAEGQDLLSRKNVLPGAALRCSACWFVPMRSRDLGMVQPLQPLPVILQANSCHCGSHKTKLTVSDGECVEQEAAGLAIQNQNEQLPLTFLGPK